MKFLQELQYVMTASGSRRVAQSLLTEEEKFMDIDMIARTAKDTTKTSSKKKSKSPEEFHVIIPETPNRKYWLGFNYTEQLAKEARMLECIVDESIEDLVARGYMRTEVEELETSIVSYPKVPQMLYLSTRYDKVLGQYYNLTQLPFKVETNPVIGLSLDFHITIYFEHPITPFEHDEILSKAQKRFE